VAWVIEMEPRVELTDTPAPEAFQQILTPLIRFNQETACDGTPRLLAVLVSDPQTGQVVGGLWGRTHWGYLYTDLLFLPEALRRNGLGTRLMRLAEEEAAKRGCHGAWVDTYDFQARGFYERLGYAVFGVLDGPSPVYPRFFLKKRLGGN
jgi:GNAT superfamily N-acetyltransferase